MNSRGSAGESDCETRCVLVMLVSLVVHSIFTLLRLLNKKCLVTTKNGFLYVWDVCGHLRTHMPHMGLVNAQFDELTVVGHCVMIAVENSCFHRVGISVQIHLP